MLVSAVEGHRLWAPQYDAEANPLVALADRALPESLGAVDGLRVVDVACGTGRWMVWLRSHGARVVGFDLCREMLACAARKSNLGGRTALADAACLPVAPESADLVLCSLAVGYFADLEGTLDEFARVLKQGGRLVIADLHPARVAAGSVRSFTVDGSDYEMRHFNHSADRMLRAAGSAGLELQSQRDVCFGAPEEHFYRNAGMSDVYVKLRDVPGLWIVSWTKP